MSKDNIVFINYSLHREKPIGMVGSHWKNTLKWADFNGDGTANYTLWGGYI